MARLLLCILLYKNFPALQVTELEPCETMYVLKNEWFLTQEALKEKTLLIFLLFKRVIYNIKL